MMKANAIFGIKATRSWKGKVYNAKTQECYDEINYTNINACFRAYDSLEESIKDYFDLILGLPRYAKAKNCNTPLECIIAIKNGGYATSPTYVYTITSIINSNNLTKYDNIQSPINNLKSNEEIAIEVIKGSWGNGQARKNKLKNAGYNYEAIQKIVNQKLLKKSNEEIAIEVIKGLWGNGQARKNKLKNAGYNYEVIQKIVNERLK